MSIKERYSKRELERQIKSGIYERTMLANKKVSSAVKKLPQDTTNIFKDLYSLGLGENHKENDLQTSLISNLKDFILEIGKDFCFMGQEYKLAQKILKLIFYHRELRYMVAFELKIDEFSPSYLGQLDRELCRQKDDEAQQ